MEYIGKATIRKKLDFVPLLELEAESWTRRIIIVEASSRAMDAPGANQQKAQTFGPDLNVRLLCPECRDPNPKIVEEFSRGALVVEVVGWY